MIDAHRRLVPVRASERLVEHGDGEVVRLLQRAELAADVLQPVPRRVPGLEQEVGVEIVPGVHLVDAGVRVRRRPGVDLIEVPAPRRLQDRLAACAQIVGAADARPPVVPQRILPHRRKRLLNRVVLNDVVDRHALEEQPVREVRARRRDLRRQVALDALPANAPNHR